MMRFWMGLLAVLALPATALAAARPVPTQLPGTAEPVAYDLAITPDARSLSFTGRVAITLQVPRATGRIVLNAADLAIGRASLDGGLPAAVTLDAEAQTASFAFARPVAPGRHVLSVDYTGKINSRPVGLFKVDYDTAAGKGAGRMLATQFEPADARRFLPVFDEPAKKATFTVTAVVSAAQLAVSNMPQVASEPLAGGLKRVRFATTPKMSSYLLFFGSGDLERITAEVDGTTVGVVVRHGDTDKGRFALSAAGELLRYYNSYFGTRYPLPKLDLIGSPGETGGAMENWGAIQYQQTYLLIDPKLSTDADRQEVFSVIAHEMAHQWFGDLVTMAWWDDLWLNEAFASWMATKASDRFHPEWKSPLWALADKDGAMRLDARDASHPIVREIATVAQAEQAFDAITYQKGEAVLRMLESYAGEDAWRAGVRAYIARHAYGNTVGDDLWAAMDRAASPSPAQAGEVSAAEPAAEGAPAAHLPPPALRATSPPARERGEGRISSVAHDFTRQSGVPLVRAVGPCAVAAGSGVAVSVDQFRASASSTPASASPRWRVPLRAARPDGSGLVKALAPPARTLAFPGCAPAVVNYGQAGYFRTAYDPRALQGLTAAVGGLSPADQIGLLDDGAALGLAGYEPMDGFLQLAATLPSTVDPVVWDAAIDRLLSIDGYYREGPARAAYRAWAAGLLRPVLARTGLDPKPGEAINVASLRQSLIGSLARFGDPEIMVESRRRFEAFRRNPDALSASTRRWVLTAAARNADAPTWEALHALAVNATDPLEKQRFYEALALVRDPTLAERVLELALTDEPPANLGPRLVGEVASDHADLAWRFVLAHQPALAKALDSLGRTTFVPRIAAASTDPRRVDELLTYAAQNIPKDARGEVDVAVARIRQAAEIEQKRLPEVDAWLRGRR